MTKAERARRLAWRFKVKQQACERSRNVARTCRHFGISRQAFYRWKLRTRSDSECVRFSARRAARRRSHAVVIASAGVREGSAANGLLLLEAH
jgi:transposase-like protein